MFACVCVSVCVWGLMCIKLSIKKTALIVIAIVIYKLQKLTHLFTQTHTKPSSGKTQ